MSTKFDKLCGIEILTESDFTRVNINLPRYDPSKSYRWNYENAPDALPDIDGADRLPGEWSFCGYAIDSPLGISAGPLLNGQWCLYYARLGFDVLTYKTVRSGPRECYGLPNLQPVETTQLTGAEPHANAIDQMQNTWAVSFGMPSSSPDVWRRDIEATRRELDPQKRLSVSVVGTMQSGWGIDELADDYARCARWAAESGADCVETNFSCPNVSTCDGQLYQNPNDSGLVARTVRDALDKTPLVIKIGHVRDPATVEQLVAAVGDSVDAIAMTNSIALKVRRGDEELFDGQLRGICGEGTRDESIAQVQQFADEIKRQNRDTQIIGVGGIARAADVRRYLAAGASHCHLATSVMTDPSVGIKIRSDW